MFLCSSEHSTFLRYDVLSPQGQYEKKYHNLAYYLDMIYPLRQGLSPTKLEQLHTYMHMDLISDIRGTQNI